MGLYIKIGCFYERTCNWVNYQEYSTSIKSNPLNNLLIYPLMNMMCIPSVYTVRNMQNIFFVYHNNTMVDF